MRHVRSIFYALVLAPAIWVLAGVGFTHDLSSRGRELFAAESVSGLLLLIFSGILFAILTFAPVSPAGPVLAGAAFLGITVWAWNSPAAYAALWAPEVAKEGFDLSRPGYGLAGLLAIPLLGTALSARRWARYEPPVLPIIGEIGRFRGSAKVAGIPASIAETTVFRAGTGHPAADLTVPLGTPAAADRTVAMPAMPAASADRTVAMPIAAADRTVALPVAVADQTVAIPVAATKAEAAEAKAEAEPTTMLVTPAEATEVTVVEPKPVETDAEPTTMLAIPPAKPAKPADDEDKTQVVVP
ncbi:hypothetical protein [Actinoplanes sp. GCM10030250]|uniref:hypothetical protein n=1 Tax=Actinoplanes sp. GCM10030250 TaxID=3273376 RepID=UPI0036206D8A